MNREKIGGIFTINQEEKMIEAIKTQVAHIWSTHKAYIVGAVIGFAIAYIIL
jgi:hypothetical protein